MTYRRSRRGGRAAFTLIELLVVIAIIAILVSLLAAAVLRALVKGPQAQTLTEIHKLDLQLSAVKSQTGVTFLPSVLHLSKTNNYPNKNVAGSLDAISVAYLTARFGKHACCDFNPLPSAKYPQVQSIDWNGDGIATEELVLEGEQCLVFHLGGIPSYPSPGTGINMIGFSNNIQNPAAPIATQGESRQGPYYEFQSPRLVAFNTSTKSYVLPPYTTGASSNLAGTFPVYLDPWNASPTQQPYAYFASSRPEGGGAYSNDCPSLGVTPYIESTANGVTNFVNHGTFQIISAGRDGKWGLGGATWDPTKGTSDANGKDDQSNFSPNILGTATN